MFLHDINYNHFDIAHGDTLTDPQTLATSQKLEGLGMLAGGIAHEFNNILESIMGYTNLLQAQLKSEEPEQRYLTKIERAVEHAASLVQQLLGFARKKKSEQTRFVLNTLMDEAAEIFTRILTKSITVRMKKADYLPAVD